MECFCCQSNKFILKLIDKKKYHECHKCGFISAFSKACTYGTNIVLNHYQNYDPHDQIATSKQAFFSCTLDYLSSEIKTKPRSLLDVGCGFGYLLELASKNDWSTYGVEIVGSAVEVARKKLGKKNIFHGFLRHANYPDEYFDAITLWDVLVMVDNPTEELRECYRILKRGGKLGIRVRNVDFQKIIYHLYIPLSKAVSVLRIKRPYVFHPHNFTKTSLYSILRRAGFSDIQIINSPMTKGDPYGYTQISGLTSIIKYIADIYAKTVYKITQGRLTLGPSLLAWAEKT